MLPAGDYSKPAIPWDKLHIDCFRASLFSNYAVTSTIAAVGCGPAALAVLLDVSPIDLYNSCRKKMDPTDEGTTGEVMVEVLREYGAKVFPVTLRDLNPAPDRVVESMAQTHILLTAGMLAKDTASWFVYWNGFEWHAGLQRKVTPDIIMNRFICMNEAYVIIPPRKRVDSGAKMLGMVNGQPDPIKNLAEKLKAFKEAIE